jgi:glycosyltransferase involved in cell wall biosynthesis
MTRIVYVSHSASLDGATKVLANLLCGSEKDSVQPLVIFPVDGPIVRMVEKAGVPYRIIDIGHLGWDLHHIPMLQLLFREEKADCIHANTTVSYPAVLAAKLAGIPAVWHIHEMLSHKQYYAFNKVDQTVLHEVIRCSDRICVASEAGQSAFIDYCIQHNVDIGNKMRIIHNGIRIPEAAQPLDRNQNFTITAIGNMVRLKGLRYLIEAFAELAKDYPDVKLQIVGKVFPAHFLELYKLAEESGVKDRVNFRTETSEIEDVYLKSHVIVCASVIETFPMVVLEALSYGKPVVATRVGGIPELVVDGVTGRLVPPEDSSALAGAIKSYLDNWDEALRMGNRGRLHMSEQFSLTAQMRKFAMVYEELVTNKTGATTSPPRLEELKGILYDHMVRESEKLHQMQRETQERFLEQRLLISRNTSLISGNTETIAKTIEDLRTLEGVVANLLNRWPFRLMRALKSALRPTRKKEG